MADNVRFTLNFPFQSATGDTVTSMSVTRLKRRELSTAQLHAKGDEAALEDHLVAKMLGITVEDLMEFDIADSKRASDLFRAMVGGGDLAAFLGRSASASAEDAAVGD
ncbi:phage tail assembly protein [Pseudomonas rubra]|uniref:Phage tail assembly protein n=1 Tax=Pseudomonas rubra TaxID=2942627 RepID=A0ABT5PFV7_9PSED|nr:phage tail assembly protein [Pseudomonas rubra]MDD1016834.1 phage tail assembly protein [Pseudomonas rubra]MDD1041473.1 phage tail assembly protein [Pseudomonas rubra]MDD1154978.1 phage tail assembly protein [Pseudomonas rubra]